MIKYLAFLFVLMATPLFAANEVLVMRPGYTGQTMYMLVFDETGQAWNGSAFATFTSTQSTFDVVMTEVGTTGLFRGSIPGTSGFRTVVCYLQAGGSPANTDQAVQLDSGYYDTTAGWKVSTLATDAITAAKIAADAITSSEIAAGAIASGTEATGFGTAQTGDAYARLGAPVGASLSADIAATKAAAEAAETAAEEAGVGLKDTRDLAEVQHTWVIRRTGDGSWRSTPESTLYLTPGPDGVTDYRVGFDCNIPSICPNGTVLASMGDTPTSSNADISVTKLGIGPNGTRSPIMGKVSLDVEPDSTGEGWVRISVNNSLGGGPFSIWGKVVLLEAPDAE